MATFDQVTEGMNLDLANKILAEGVTQGAFEEDAKYDEAQRIEFATELCRISKTAFDTGVRADAVLAILKTAGIDANGGAQAADPPPAADDGPVTLYNHSTGEVQEFPAPAVDPMLASGWSREAPQTQEPESSDDSGFDINSVIPGYDDLNAKDAATALKGIGDEETFNAIKAYEEAHEDRKSVRNVTFTPPKTETTQATPPPAAAGPSSDPKTYGDTDSMKVAYEAGSVGKDTIAANQLPEPGIGDLEIQVEIDKLSDVQLAQLQTRYHNADVRALVLLGEQEGLRDIANRLASEAYAGAYPRLLEVEKGEIPEDKRSASAITDASSRAKQKADNDSSVSAWRNRESRHGSEIRNLKAYQAAYEKGVARLSREQTRREKEKELGGSRAS